LPKPGTKKAAPEHKARERLSLILLRHPLRNNRDILSTRTLGTLAFVVIYNLALTKALVSGSLDGRMVEENISTLAFDESKTLVRQLLNRTLRHFATPKTKNDRRNDRPRVNATAKPKRWWEAK
jgi:hypothetical protein